MIAAVADPAAALRRAALRLTAGDGEEASRAARIAVACAPAAPVCWVVLAVAAGGAGDSAAAATAALRALRLDPCLPDARYNLAHALTTLGRRAAAVAVLRGQVALTPDAPDAWSRLGQVFFGDGRAAVAAACWRRDAALRLDLDEPQWRLGLALLLAGRLGEGWALYERRPQPAPPADGSRRWRGREDLTGRSVLIQQEQGLGDMIQFIRYAAALRARGAGRVVVDCPPPLRRLLADAPGVDGWADAGTAACDFHIPLMSLPGALGTTLRNVPAPVPYLRADPARIARWRERIGEDGFRVGVVWAGKPSGGRSAPLAAFAPLAAVPGVRLFSLQKHHGLADLNALPAGMRVETLGEDFDVGPDAFLDTAAAACVLDLVVSVDAAPAHVAGALGRPAWLALSAAPDWRWFIDFPDRTPWYPATRLFRQPRPGDWRAVAEAMAARLSLAEGRGQALGHTAGAAEWPP